jgi:hypothetical protein
MKSHENPPEGIKGIKGTNGILHYSAEKGHLQTNERIKAGILHRSADYLL